jgi:SAM-dependent methyltransferase
LRAIRRVVGQTQAQLGDSQSVVIEQLAQLGAMMGEQAERLAEIKARLDQLSGSTLTPGASLPMEGIASLRTSDTFDYEVTAETLGTLTEAVGAACPHDTDLSNAIDFAIRLHRDSAHVPLLAALDPQEVRALAQADTLQVPPPHAREGYFPGEDMAYWISGLGDRLLLEDLGRRLGRPLSEGSRLLDLGSSSGRVLRHFATAHPRMHAIGVDIGHHSVEWVRQHLSPAVTVVLGTPIPHLPFPDSFFDCIYAGSVFTHTADFEETWLLELSRVLAPAGFAVLTFHPGRTWSEIGQNQDHLLRKGIEGRPHRLDPGAIEPVRMEIFVKPMPAERVVLTATDLPLNYSNNPQVFHSETWIRERWGRFFTVELIVPHAHGGHQDAAVLTRST